MARKESKKAISEFRERLKFDPADLPSKFSLAELLLQENELDEALAEYRELAEVFTKQGFILKAIAVYKKMLEIRPGSKDVEKLLAKLAKKKDQKSALSLEVETKLLKNLSYEEFRQIVHNFILRHFEEETVIVKEGDPGDSFFILVRGEVRVITRDAKNREIVLGNLADGNLFGEVSLLTGKPRTATVITNMASDLLELSRFDYERMTVKYPRIRRVVEALHEARAEKTIEAMIRAYREK